MIRMLLAATLIAGGTTIAIAQGAGGGTGTVTRDDNRPAASASGRVVCNGNVCWRTTERYDYPADSGSHHSGTRMDARPGDYVP